MQTSARYPWGKGTPTWVRDVTPNDSDKSFVVPPGKIWELIEVGADITATAVVGARYMGVSVTDGANFVHMCNALTAVAGTQTGAGLWGAGIPWSIAVRRTFTGVNATVGLSDPLPFGMVLLPGYAVRVWDVLAVDPAADDMNVILHYIEYDE